MQTPTNVKITKLINAESKVESNVLWKLLVINRFICALHHVFLSIAALKQKLVNSKLTSRRIAHVLGNESSELLFA